MVEEEEVADREEQKEDEGQVTHSPAAVALAKELGVTDEEIASLTPEALDSVNLQIIKLKKDRPGPGASKEQADQFISEVDRVIGLIENNNYETELTEAIRVLGNSIKRQYAEIVQSSKKIQEVYSHVTGSQAKQTDDYINGLVEKLDREDLFGKPGSRTDEQETRFRAVVREAIDIAQSAVRAGKHTKDEDHMATAFKKLFGHTASSSSSSSTKLHRPAKPSLNGEAYRDGEAEAKDIVARFRKKYGYK